MMRIKKWLESKFFQRQTVAVVEPPRARLPRKKANVQTDEYEIDATFTSGVRGKIESMGPGKNVLVSDFTDNYEETVPDLEIIEEVDGGPATGFNPYDTTVLQKQNLFKPRKKTD